MMDGLKWMNTILLDQLRGIYIDAYLRGDRYMCEFMHEWMYTLVCTVCNYGCG